MQYMGWAQCTHGVVINVSLSHVLRSGHSLPRIQMQLAEVNPKATHTSDVYRVSYWQHTYEPGVVALRIVHHIRRVWFSHAVTSREAREELELRLCSAMAPPGAQCVDEYYKQEEPHPKNRGL